MNSENPTDFLVNLALTDEDLFSLKSLILAFIAEKAESQVIAHYRPGAHQVFPGGLILKGSFNIEDPSKEDFNKVIDLVKNAHEIGPNMKTKKVILIAIPLYSVPTGKKE